MQWLAFLGWGCSSHKLRGSESCGALQLQNSLYMILGSLYNPACNVPLFPQDTPG